MPHRFMKTLTAPSIALFALVMLLIGFAAHRPAAAQTTHTVTSLDDAGAGTLRDALAAANAGDEIRFDDALAGQTLTLTSGALSIERDVILAGPGMDALSISGNGASRVIAVQAGVKATLSDLTLRDGYATDIGGCIWVGQGADLTLNRTRITGNRALDNGGGVYIHSAATLLIADSEILDNEAGGDFSPNGGGIYNAAGTVRIERSTVSGNRSTRGGGIWNASAGTMTIHASTISGNTADNEGGGIYNNKRLTITSSTVSGNTAAQDAGGIRNRGGDTLAVVNSTISGNASGRTGGLMNADFGTTVLRNSTVVDNRSGFPGAGIWNGEDAKTFLYSTIVASNLAEGDVLSDLIDQRLTGIGIVSQGFNFISNSDPDARVNARNVFIPLASDLVGSAFFPRNPFLHPLADNGGPTLTHRPQAASILIDNGDCQRTGFDVDQIGGPRLVDIPGDVFSNASDGCDIGAVEASLSVALPVEDQDRPIPMEALLTPAYPNPFAHATRLKLTLTFEQDVTIALHDALGRQVRSLHAGRLQAHIPYVFDIEVGDLAGGVYVVTAAGEAFRVSRPVILLK
ncbi:MAG: right-handed parallel beta-helix repeat-containing protein [Rhodothermales bacterium]